MIDRATHTEQPGRPFGVSLLTIWNGYAGGLAPLLAVVRSLQAGVDSPGLALIASLALAGALLFTCIGAFRGHDRARLGMLWFITLHYSLRALEPVAQLAAGQVPQDTGLAPLARIGTAGFWVAVNAWYFLRPTTLRFYRRPSSPSV